MLIVVRPFLGVPSLAHARAVDSISRGKLDPFLRAWASDTSGSHLSGSDRSAMIVLASPWCSAVQGMPVAR